MRLPVSALIVALLLLCTQSRAQFLSRIGVKAALTSASQSMKNEIVQDMELKRRTGFAVAAFADLFDLPAFSLVAQVEYAQRGMGLEVAVTGPEGPEIIGKRTLYARLDYLSIPLLAKVKFPMPLLTPYLLAGPRADFSLGSSLDEGVFREVYDKFRKSGLGGSVGLGVETATLLPADLLLEFRYNVDFADAYSSNVLKIRNSAFDIWIGAAF